MSPPPRRDDHPADDVAVIASVALAAGHDGAAEAVIGVRYPNGAVRHVTFTAEALAPAIAASRLASLDDLVGLPWTILVSGAPSGDN